MGSGGKKPRTTRTSGGTRGLGKAKKDLRRLKMKIKRWKRYQTDNTKTKTWRDFQNPHLRSRHNNWDISGLERRIKQLESQIKRGPKKVNRPSTPSMFA